MKRYRFKPIIIEAQQWHTGDPPLEGMVSAHFLEEDAYYVVRGRRLQRVFNNDWIAKEDGGFNVIDSLTFDLYEPVEEP